MTTDRELADAAWNELALTTDIYSTWKRKGYPATSHWGKAKKLQDQISTVPPPVGGVKAPLPPSPYATPTGTVVSNSAQLIAALSIPSPNIALMDGIYDTGSVLDIQSAKIRAMNLGGSIFKMGVHTRTPGSLLQGMVFDVVDANKTLESSCIHLWDSPTINATILDVVMRSNQAVNAGVRAAVVDGLTIQRCQAYNFSGYGYRLDENNQQSVQKIKSLTDLVAYGMPNYVNGTEGVGIWIGNPVINPVERIKAYGCATAAMELVTASADTKFRDIDLTSFIGNGDGIALYLEHFALRHVFNSFYFNGRVNGEWADPNAGNSAGSHFCKWDGGTSEARLCGFYFDQGTESPSVINTKFIGQTKAAVGAYLNIGTSDFNTGNDYTQMAPGAVKLRTDHINGW